MRSNKKKKLVHTDAVGYVGFNCRKSMMTDYAVN